MSVSAPNGGGTRSRIAVVFALCVAGTYLGDPGAHRTLLVEMRSDRASVVQLYFDLGAGMREGDSVSAPILAGRDYSSLRFHLPRGALRGLRLDPIRGAGTFSIRSVRVEDANGAILRTFGGADLIPANQIAGRNDRRSATRFTTIPDATDPYLLIARSDLPSAATTWFGSPASLARALGLSLLATASLVALGFIVRRLASWVRGGPAPEAGAREAGAGGWAARWLRERGDVVFGLLTGGAILVALFPEFVTFARGPMVADSWALQDPIVSVLVFSPGTNVVRREALEHANLLWSNLRGLGLPILGNEIAAAPLFPLTLLFLPIPEPYYWNFLVLGRLVLTGLAAFLIGIRYLRLSRTSAVAFTISLVYCIHVLRWLNHSWQNGLLAGLWYLYFVLRVVGANERSAFGRWTANRAWNVLGLAASAYGMVTCGFPEAAAMSAVLVILVVPSFAIAGLRSGPLPRTWPRVALDLVLANLMGLMLAAPQVFALVEFIGLATAGPHSETKGFREGLGTIQFPGFGAMKGWLTPFGEGLPPGSLVHLVGLIPAFLVLLGVTRRLSSPRCLDWRDGAALTCLAFFLAKNFPIWPALNEVVGTLPILRESWFIVYFLPIFLWFIAFYAALGMEWVVEAPKGLALAALGCAAALLGVVTLLSRDIAHQSYWHLLATGSRLPTLVLGAFLAFWLLGVLGGRLRTGLLPDLRCGALLALMVFELVVMHPGGFRRLDDPGDPWDRGVGERIALLGREHGKQEFDLRINDPYGAYVSSGIATVDAGGPPILHRRLQLLRTKLFAVQWNGHLPLEGARFPYSWEMVSNNLFLGSESDDLAARFGCDRCEALGEVTTNWFLHWNPDALPRAYVPSGCTPSQGLSQSLAFLTRGDFRTGHGYLETSDPMEQRVCSDHHPGAVTPVAILEDSGSALRLAELRGPAILALNDNFYPGWHARDETSGKELSIRAMNVSFRAVVLPEARVYRVRFRYWPRWLWTALALTSLGGAGMLACLVISRRGVS